jgi:hypothetical protein
MKRILFGTFALLCLAVFIPAAFAAEDVAGTGGNDAPFFNPTLRVGCAFDVSDAVYDLQTENFALAGLTRSNLKLPSTPRVYLAAELPVAVTDRLTLSLGGSWAFYTKGKDFHESVGTFAIRNWDRDNRDDWVTADFTASYAFVKDISIIKNLSLVGSLRWSYRDMFFTDPYVAGGTVASSPTDEIDIQMQTLAPVFGLTCTLAGRESGFFGGDIKLGAMAGPVVWSKMEWRETFTPTFQFGFNGHPSHGYVVNAFVELPIFSGTVKPGIDGSLSFFADYTRTSINGTVDGARIAGGVPIATSPYHFESLSNVVVLGINASLAFDLRGRPEPGSPPPALAPAIEPKLEPMSQK